MHAGDDQQGPEGAHDAHSQEAQLSLHEVDECGDALADHDAGRADHDDRNGSSNEEDQHGLEEVLGDSRGDLVDGTLNVRQDPGHAQGRDDGVGVLDAHHRDAQEVCGGIADRDRLHHGAEIRVQHQACNGNGDEHIGVELLGSRSGHHHRQEVEGCVTDGVQDLVGLTVGRQHACHAQQHDQQLDHGAADDGGDQRGHGAHDGIQNVVAHLLQGQGLLLLAAGHLACLAEVAHLEHFVVGLFHMVANDDLVLAALVHDAHDAVGRLDGCVVDLALVLHHEAKAGHAVGHAGNVLHTADVLHDLFGDRSIIFCHDCFSFTFSSHPISGRSTSDASIIDAGRWFVSSFWA